MILASWAAGVFAGAMPEPWRSSPREARARVLPLPTQERVAVQAEAFSMECRYGAKQPSETMHRGVRLGVGATG